MAKGYDRFHGREANVIDVFVAGIYMSLDAKTVAKMARLARIGLSDEEIQAHQEAMQGIIGWVDQLNEVDISDVPPMIGTGLAQPRLRQDEVTDGNCREAVLSNAPEREGPFYTVPKVVE